VKYTHPDPYINTTVWGFQPLFALDGHLEIDSTPNFACLENNIKIYILELRL
jgi:hypothetical protein